MASSSPRTQSPTQARTQIVKQDDPLDATTMESPKLRNKQAPVRTASQRRQELEKTNFHLSEQVKDLKYQLSGKSNEITKLQENLAARSSEHDEKMKKMREIFAQATKNLDGYRASIAAKDLEIQRLRDDLEQYQVREQELRSNVETQSRDTEKLTSEVNSQKALYGSQINQLEAKVRQLSSQLQQTRNDYDQYKKRAGQLLQKNNKNAQTESSRLSELEDTIRQLRVDKNELETEKADNTRKIELLEHDVRQALERVQHLETDNEALVKVKEDNNAKQTQIHRLQERLAADRISHEQALKASEEAHESSVRRLKESLERAKQNKGDDIKSPEQEKNSDEREAMDRIMELLHDENSQLRQQLATKEQELAFLQNKQPEAKEDYPVQQPSTPSPQDNHSAAILNTTSEDTPVEIDVYASMSHLLSPFVGGGTGNTSTSSDNRIDLEKQIQQLRDMLDESEDRVTALRTQEKILKDEIRKLDSFDRRQNLSIEYLKNVLLKFLQSENKEFMVPVLAKLLSLSPDETDELRKSVMI